MEVELDKTAQSLALNRINYVLFDSSHPVYCRIDLGVFHKALQALPKRQVLQRLQQILICRNPLKMK